MYCSFIDYEKAFDTILRNELWFKLFEIGVSSKMVKILQSIYRQVSACIKLNSNLSDFFEISLGLKQGEPLADFIYPLRKWCICKPWFQFVNGKWLKPIMHSYVNFCRRYGIIYDQPRKSPGTTR